MATRVFNQTDDTTPTCALAVGCSGRSLGAGTNRTWECLVAGGLGLSALGISVPASATDVIALGWCCVPASAFVVAAGTAEVRINVDSVGGTAPFMDEIHICKFNSGCTNQATIGSLTGINTILTTGIKTYNVTVSTTSIGATDVIMVLVVFTNPSSMASATANVMPDQTITFTEGTLGGPCRIPLMGVS